MKLVIKILLSLQILIGFGIQNAISQESGILAKYTYFNVGLQRAYDVNLSIYGNRAFSQFTPSLANADTAFIDDAGNGQFSNSLEDETGKQYFTNPESKAIIFRDFVYTTDGTFPAIVEESLPDFDWQLHNTVKKIGQFNCSMASTEFRGRTYEVWYTLEIPTPFGPWKFYGLPGLIVQIKSLDNNIQFYLSEIKKYDQQEITPPNDGKPTSFEEYVNYKNNLVNAFVSKLQSKLPRGAKVTVNSSSNYNIEKVFDENIIEKN